MSDNLIKTSPDKEKAKSIIKMVETTLQLIETIDETKFASSVVKEYYDVIRELASAALLLDGYKTKGEGAHKKLIEYLEKNCSEFSEHDIFLMDDLRITRNRIAYDGFFVKHDYLERNKESIRSIVTQLKEIVNRKLKAP